MTASFDPKAFRAFAIDGYDYHDSGEPDGDGAVFTARYRLVGDDAQGDIALAETIRFGALPRRPDDRLLRLLTLTCAPSYFKTAAPGRVEIAFAATEFEVHYLRELLAGGLGEFAYRNALPGALTPEITAPAAGPYPPGDAGWDAAAPPLVPVGGGKDSVVTIEALRDLGVQPILFSVNSFEPIERCIAISGLPALRVRRAIDPRIVELNRQGAYNGHVPVTAINSVLGLIVADAHGLGPVVLSNERSSNIGNIAWLGRDINHQWSKSIHYEALLRDTLSGYGLAADRYFSLLRPLAEAEIADRFAAAAAYFDAFVSCNRPFALDAGRRGATWCGRCPKCQFVFVLLGPRLGRDRTEAIFGRNLFDDPSAGAAPGTDPADDPGAHDPDAGFADLLGIGLHKPFECVGEYYEAAESMLAILADDRWRGLPAVERLRGRAAELQAVAADRDTEPGVDFVPDRYAAALHR